LDLGPIWQGGDICAVRAARRVEGCLLTPRRVGLTNPQLPPSPERQAADPFAMFPRTASEVYLVKNVPPHMRLAAVVVISSVWNRGLPCGRQGGAA